MMAVRCQTCAFRTSTVVLKFKLTTLSQGLRRVYTSLCTCSCVPEVDASCWVLATCTWLPPAADTVMMWRWASCVCSLLSTSFRAMACIEQESW
jgi:hypothetical protein